VGGFFIDEMSAILKFIQEQWGCSDPFCEVKLSKKEWDNLSKRAYEDKLKKLTSEKEFRFCMRLVGQSGAGKTSQLLPAVKSVFEQHELPYISLAVRDFVSYYPYLSEIKNFYGEALVREKTNAFALMLLSLVFKRCVASGCPLLFEMTLLDPVYEHFVHSLFEEYGYVCDYQCLAVSKVLSDQWIMDRSRSTKRIVTSRSASFFYQILESAFLSLQDFHLKNRVFIWDCYHREPVISKVQDEELWLKFTNSRNFTGLPLLSLEEGIRVKTLFLKNFYESYGFFCR